MKFVEKNDAKRIICAIMAVVMMFTASAFTSFAAGAEAAGAGRTVEVTGTRVNIREGAGTGYDKVGVALNGQQYAYLDQQTVSGSTWYKIQYDADTAAWISALYSEVVENETQPETLVKVTGTRVNVREGAGTGYAKVGVALNGQQYAYLDRQTVSGSTWYKIQYGADTAAWISALYSEVVETAAPDAGNENAPAAQRDISSVRIVSENVPVQLEIGHSDPERVGLAASGEQYAYLGQETLNGEIWYKVKHTGGQECWVSGDHCVLLSSKGEVKVDSLVEITGTKVNLRAGAGTGFDKVDAALRGELFPLVGRQAVNGAVWYQVQYNADTTLWVSASYSRVIEAPNSNSSDVFSERNVVVTASRAKFRHNIDGDVWYTAKKGDKFTLVGTVGTLSGDCWYRVVDSSCRNGWVRADDTRIEITQTEVENVNVIGALAELRLRYAEGQNWTGSDYTNVLGKHLYGTAADCWNRVLGNADWDGVMESICVGDVIRCKDGRTVMVTSVKEGQVLVTGLGDDGRIVWDTPFTAESVDCVFHHADNRFRTNDATAYVSDGRDSAKGKVRIDAAKHSPDADGILANVYPDYVADCARVLDGDVYYYYETVCVDLISYVKVRLNSEYVWIPVGSGHYVALDEEFPEAVEEEEKEEVMPCAAWTSDEAVNAAALEMCAYAESIGLERIAGMSEDGYGRSQSKHTNFSATQAEFVEDMTDWLDFITGYITDYAYYDYTVEHVEGPMYAVNIYLG